MKILVSSDSIFMMGKREQLFFLPLPGLEWVPQYVVVNAFQG